MRPSLYYFTSVLFCRISTMSEAGDNDQPPVGAQNFQVQAIYGEVTRLMRQELMAVTDRLDRMEHDAR